LSFQLDTTAAKQNDKYRSILRSRNEGSAVPAKWVADLELDEA